MPGYPVVHDIGIGLTCSPNLAYLDPVAFDQIHDRAPQGAAGELAELCNRLLGDDHGIVVPEVGTQDVHHR